MISFASERGLGQDLATHLLNEHDNEEMELAEVRGAVAQDLHGAFAEWEFQAHARTKCKNYLFSLSVNPWEVANGRLTREQYFDYIDRTEARLGLSDQPRAVVFHIKDGREHCHVVWSRIDTGRGKAVHLPFFKDTMMMVTRDFAREHGLELPKGYEKRRDGKSSQLSLYEMHQQRAGGLSKEEHKQQVTDAWRMSDSPKAFVQALADRGYILATGKRPYVLVDLYGHMNALPKLIDDKTVRTKDIRGFLKTEFPPESLPSVEDARAVAAKHRKALEGHLEHEQKAEALAELKTRQAARRATLGKQQAALRHRQHDRRQRLFGQQKAVLADHQATHTRQIRRIRQQRYERRPQGLAAFLGRVTGVELVRKKLHRYRDRKRYQTFLKEKNQLQKRHDRQRAELQRRHDLQALDLARKLRAMDQIEKRELRSLEQSLFADQRVQARGGCEHMPAFSLAQEGERGTPVQGDIDLTGEFGRAARGDDSDGSGEDTEGQSPAKRSKVDQYRRQKSRKRDHDKDRGQ